MPKHPLVDLSTTALGKAALGEELLVTQQAAEQLADSLEMLQTGLPCSEREMDTDAYDLFAARRAGDEGLLGHLARQRAGNQTCPADRLRAANPASHQRRGDDCKPE